VVRASFHVLTVNRFSSQGLSSSRQNRSCIAPDKRFDAAQPGWTHCCLQRRQTELWPNLSRVALAPPEPMPGAINLAHPTRAKL
jgi:hypothetical protein